MSKSLDILNRQIKQREINIEILDRALQEEFISLKKLTRLRDEALNGKVKQRTYYVLVEPIAKEILRWMQQDVKNNTTLLSTLTGIKSDTLEKYAINRNKVMDVETADKILTTIGSSHDILNGLERINRHGNAIPQPPPSKYYEE